jgi:pyruvate/oxaloacetate carboxyltransferase
MNTQTQEALKMAIETLEKAQHSMQTDMGVDVIDEAITACKEALEQPAQEPVAWMHRHAGEITEFNDFQSCEYCEPLYTHPHQWQGLTDKEIQKRLSKISDDMYPWKDGMLGHLIARAIEQALKDKNEK